MKHLQYFDIHEDYLIYLKNDGLENSPYIAHCDNENENHYVKESNVLTFVAEQDNSTIRIDGIQESKHAHYTCRISINDTQWEIYEVNYYGSGRTLAEEYYYSGRTITLQEGEYVRFIGNSNTSSDDIGGKTASAVYYYFVMEGKIGAYGDVTSLRNEVGGDVKFNCGHLFENCTALTHAPNLPSTLFFEKDNYTKSFGYYNMFKGCTSLITPPEIKIQNLTEYCFRGMFSGCTSLTAAPSLPCTTLSAYCYQSMFEGCTSLSAAPVLPATNLQTGCYHSMFRTCTSLVKAPRLYATSAVTYCYYYMFKGCSNLNYIYAMFRNSPTNTCLGWVEGVSSTGTFYKSRYASWNDTYGSSSIPSGWTIYKV